jgi:hypothetical protein
VNASVETTKSDVSDRDAGLTGMVYLIIILAVIPIVLLVLVLSRVRRLEVEAMPEGSEEPDTE